MRRMGTLLILSTLLLGVVLVSSAAADRPPRLVDGDTISVTGTGVNK